jgi:anaerobic nitric oxide reductase flavorubredoxin
MSAIEVRPNISWIGVNDRTTDLFEGLWPIDQEGVSYNSYLICDQKNVLIDLTKAFKSDEYLAQMARIVDIADIDYVVINHMEPDHSGLLFLFRQLAPKAVFLATEKACDMLEAFYGITENVESVADGETLSLGDHELRFVTTPFVHWPETMMTYETTQKILFAGDGFGSYGALRGTIFEDEAADLSFYEREALRYYATIIAKFSVPVLKAIDKLRDVPVEVIAPAHGLVWRSNPRRIVELYEKWAHYVSEPGELAATLVYASMYGNTEHAMNAVAQGISAEGVPLQIFDAGRTHAAYILPSIWANRGVMIGAPTYEAGLFPPTAHLLDLALRKRMFNKKAAWFGSYAWSGGAQKEIEPLLQSLKWELTETFEFRGGPTAEDMRAAEEFGRRFGQALKA